MPFFDLNQQPTRELFPGVWITTAWGEHLMMSFVEFRRADARVPEHQHPHEQLGMCLEGRFELVIAGEAKILQPGECYCIPGNTPHSARSLDAPAKALDIFHPPREDYK